MRRIDRIKAVMGVVCVAIAFGILMLAPFTPLTATAAVALIITGIVLTWLIKPGEVPAESEGE